MHVGSSAVHAGRGQRGSRSLTTHEFRADPRSRCHLAAEAAALGHVVFALFGGAAERTVGAFAPAPLGSVPPIPPNREPRNGVSVDRLARATTSQGRASADGVLLRWKSVATSPTHMCANCRGRGRVFSIRARPPSAGIPRQERLADDSVLLSYPDGSTGIVQIWLCRTCRGTGLRPRFGPSDVRAMNEWARLNAVELAEPVHTPVRGILIGARVREGDALSGELVVSEDTRHAEASTTLRRGDTA